MADMDTRRTRRATPVLSTATRRPPNRAETRRKIQNHLAQVHSRAVRSVMEQLTAAAQILDPTVDTYKDRDNPNAVTRTWQHACWGYAKTVPELGAAKVFVGNCLARCALAVGKRNPDGSVEQGFDGDEPVKDLDKAIAAEAADLISHLRSEIGGQSELLRSYGEKEFVAGESYMLPIDTPAGMVFDVLSTQELARDGDHYVRYLGPGGAKETIPKNIRPIRIWRPDAQYGQLADSSVRACMEILEELVILTRLVRSAAISRIALAGILAIADEFDAPLDEAAGDGSQDELMNPLAVDMVNTGSKAIDDPASAAAWMPYILQGSIEAIERGLKLITFHTDDAEHVVKRREAVERLAQGLDLPVEIVLGHQSTTFANAMQVSEDTFKLHIEPILQLLCDALTVGYLWPAMAKKRGIDAAHLKDAPYPDEILGVAVTYDARKLISRPDRVKEMGAVYTKDQTFSTIRISEMREALGLDPDQAPDDDEINRRILAYRSAHIREVEALPSDAATPVGDPDAPQTALVDTSIKPGEPIPTGDDAARQAIKEAATTASLIMSVQIAALAELTIERACEKVGAKLRTKLQARPIRDVQRQAVESCSNADVAKVLGPEMTAKLLNGSDPVPAEVKAMERAVHRFATDLGFDDPAGIAERAGTMADYETRQRLFGEPRKIPVELCTALVAAR